MMSLGTPIATVFEDPRVDISDTKVYRTRTQQLVIRGSGFNKMVRPILDFDPPLDSAKLHVNVRRGKTGKCGMDTCTDYFKECFY